MDDAGFKDRLGMIVKKEKSLNDFAKKCGISESLVRNYMSGKSLPGLDKLVVISNIADVEIKWLATGEGELTRGEDSFAATTESPKINNELLARLLEAYFSLKENDEIPISPKKKAHNLVMFYDMLKIRYSQKDMTVENIMQFISAFSDLAEVAVKHGFADQPNALEMIFESMVKGGLYPGIKKKEE